MRHEGQDRERRKVKEAEAETKSQYPVPEVPKKVDSGGNLGPLIEFSTEARDDPNEGLIFGDMPERCTCPHCERAVVTFIDYEASWVTWLLAIVVWFSLGWMAFWVLPLLWPAFKDVVHHCPRCLNVIARKSRISLPTFRTEVCSIKVGNCAVVLARKYVIIFLGLLATIVAVYCLRSFVHVNGASPEVSKGVPSKLNWEDFLFDCGPKSSLRSRGSSAMVFDENFSENWHCFPRLSNEPSLPWRPSGTRRRPSTTYFRMRMEVAHPDRTQRMTRKVEEDERRTLEVIQKGLMAMAVTVLATTTISRMPHICCAGSSYVYIPSKGLSLPEATLVSFNSGLGATLSVVAYAAGLSGYMGFMFVILISTATAIVEQQTLMRASVDCKATTFEEMCQKIPAWARQTTIWSGLIYLWTCGGFYYDFLDSFLEGQLCPVLCASNGDAWLCQSQWHLALPLFVMIYVVCSPAELSGRLSRFINSCNTVVKAVVVVAAIAKGLLTWSSNILPSQHWAWQTRGFFRTASILMGSLANSGIMPQLVADVKPEVQLEASRWCPIIAVSMQALVFSAVGLSGYAALGSSVQLDIFRVYQQKCPDLWTSILQGGFAVMMYLGFPLVILPCKSQVWSFLARQRPAEGSGGEANGEEGDTENVPLSAAPYAIQSALTLFFALSCVLVPLITGEAGFGIFMLTMTCTAGVWLNLLLPAVVLIYSKILPPNSTGRTMDMPSLLTVGWILLLGLLCLFDGIKQLVRLSSGSRPHTVDWQLNLRGGAGRKPEEGWRRYFTRKQASFDAIARNCTPENEAYKRRLGTPFDHSFDRNLGAIKCATIRDVPLSFERAKGCEGAQAGQWRHIFQAKPAATRPQLKHLTSLREMPGQHPGMTISDNRSDTCWVEMLGKKRWENCQPENPLERHPREGGDVKLHHLYYLKVRPEPDDEARTVRTTKTPRLAPKAKAKAKK
eukprot:s945_g22.t4